mmetsp:Transcript_110098/g.211978  ORF Transcript_110098/g.211978 Transcript_110098/m.211978 type:complete len:169 (+) Transcript_110098:241-747(+)
MKPDWDKLMGEYASSSTILVGDVDCTAAGKAKCDEVGIRGYPTIKYGDPDDLQDYQGGRDFASLKKFTEGLGPLCSPANLDLCDDEKKKKIEEYTALGAADREKMIAEKDAEVTKLEADFKTFVEGLQKQYSDASSKKDADVEALKASGLGLLKAVHNYEKKTKKAEL